MTTTNNYYDKINNFNYFITDKDLTVSFTCNSKEFKEFKEFQEFGEIYIDQFINFYNDLNNQNITYLDELFLTNFEEFQFIQKHVKIYLDFVKLPVKKLVVADNSFIIEKFDKHFEKIKIYFGPLSILWFAKNSTFSSIFTENIPNIKNNNYDKLIIEHHLNYCSIDYNLCKIRKKLRLRNVSIKNIYGEKESDNDLHEEYSSWLVIQ